MLDNEIYNITIDNINYQIKISNIHKLLTMDDESFKKICTNKNIKMLYNIPKEYFIYACYSYYRDLNNKVQITPQISRRISILGHHELVDFEAINKDIKTIDAVYNTVEVNQVIKSMITKDMPNTLTTLEKAIYIYIKMCQIFTYDREYFALNQTYDKTIDYITTLNQDNLEIACFEFVVIYGQMLEQLGINFRSYYGNKQNRYEFRELIDDGTDQYGKNHAYTEFRVGKFLIDADSTESIFEGDLVLAKLHKQLNGLKCLNSNRDTQEEFNEIYTKVYNIIKQQNKSSYINEKYLNKVKELSLEERITIFLNEAAKTTLEGMDACSYLILLKRELFTQEELLSNIKINAIRNNQPDNSKSADLITIITTNINGFEIDYDNNKYYIYTPNKELIPTNYTYIQRQFNNEIFQYVRIQDPSIPSIVEPGIMSSYRKKH